MQRLSNTFSSITWLTKFNRDGTKIASSSSDNSISIWTFLNNQFTSYTIIRNQSTYFNFDGTGLMVMSAATLGSLQKAWVFNFTVNCSSLQQTDGSEWSNGRCVCRQGFNWDSEGGCMVDCTKISRALQQTTQTTCSCMEGYYWEAKAPGCLQKDSTVFIIIISLSSIFGVVILVVSGYFARRYMMRQAARIHNASSIEQVAQ
jgi:hypothetical protein